MNNDLISRSALINAFNEAQVEFDEYYKGLGKAKVITDNAPTIEPQKGEWIIDGHHYKCSRCGKTLAIMFSETDDDDLIGCPFCLADMRGDKK